MMKVLEFKKKSELPKDILYRIDNLTENYLEVIIDAMVRLGSVEPNQEDFDRIHKLVVDAFEESLEKTIDNLL